jgi:hypothetical protein
MQDHVSSVSDRAMLGTAADQAVGRSDRTQCGRSRVRECRKLNDSEMPDADG